MRLSELQNKDIVNIENGAKIGTIIDVVVSTDGNMLGLVVQKSKFFSNMFCSSLSTAFWGYIPNSTLSTPSLLIVLFFACGAIEEYFKAGRPP